MNPHAQQADGIKKQVTLPIGTINVLKKREDLDSIDRDISLALLCKKAEKLSAASYLVTSFLSDNEPMKWQIRESALNVLLNISSMNDKKMSERDQRSVSLKTDIEKIVSLFEVAVMSGFVSEMNFMIVKEEFRSLGEAVERHKFGQPQGRYVFAREFFSDTDTAVVSAEKTDSPEQGEPRIGHVKDSFSVDEVSAKKEDNSHVLRQESESEILLESSTKSTQNLPRRNVILAFIKSCGEKGELSIKDIVGHVPGCGEKTVQRELGALVAEGVLRKTGERRWSRYSLKTP